MEKGRDGTRERESPSSPIAVSPHPSLPASPHPRLALPLSPRIFSSPRPRLSASPRRSSALSPDLPLTASPRLSITDSPSHPVIIIGGGFAGLAAAVDLAERGRRVLLLERRPFLGGRAYSFTDQTTGDTIDNGQHLLMGCYHHTLGFLDKIGARGKLKFQASPRVDFLHAREGAVAELSFPAMASFRCPLLPAPLHLLAGLMRLETIGWRDRVGALRVGLALRRWRGSRNGTESRLAEITVREWLNELGQSERMQRRFWDVMALAMLNQAPERAAADLFARVLEQAFLRTRRDSQMVISRVGLSDLYTGDARAFIEARGGEVRLNAPVARIEFAGDRASAVVLRGGERLAAEAVISAVPCFALPSLLPDEIASRESFRRIGGLTASPIVSINLWYDAPITELEFAGLLDSPIEWVFNKNAIAAPPGSSLAEPNVSSTVGAARRRQHLALVISGADEAAAMPKERLVEIAIGELQRFFPAARAQRPVHWFVVKEREATISHLVGTTQLRPAQRTPFSNFLLAGDWTATGLPATIEGAVWSGQECARIINNVSSQVAEGN
jgi:squalene-associated FAD-dependent desaturase